MARNKSLENEAAEMTESSVLAEPKAAKQILRGISKGGAAGESVASVDAYLSEYLNSGYRLVTAQVIENTTEYVYVYYMLVKD